MKKVITYGTYDLLHYGHIRLLKRAKALGDYLIVGVTSDDFDKTRGKIDVHQSLEERVAAVKATGLADQVIIEEYEGQKIDDIRKYNVDIFTVGSDWLGHFDYLNEFCKVVYLDRTKGVSSTELRSSQSGVKLGLVGYSSFLNKFYNETRFVKSITVSGLCSRDLSKLQNITSEIDLVTDNYQELLDSVDAVYIHSHPEDHFMQCKEALIKGKHVLCESPVAKTKDGIETLYRLSKENNCTLVEGIRTAYLTGYFRMLLLLKSGIIGKVTSIDSTCTSLSTYGNFGDKKYIWGALEAWGPTALLPVFQILGTKFTSIDIFSIPSVSYPNVDGFTKLSFNYPDSTATIKVGTTIKSESQLLISGNKGYIFVPSPWWKTDYFEVRYEDSNLNKRYFYQIEGEGIRYELVKFVAAVNGEKPDYYLDRSITTKIAEIMEMVNNNGDKKV